jgi:hypothetical protein
MGKYTRKVCRRLKTTLETSGEETHSKGLRKWENTLETSVFYLCVGIFLRFHPFIQGMLDTFPIQSKSETTLETSEED